MMRLFIIETENKIVKVKESFKTGSQKSQQCSKEATCCFSAAQP